MQLGTFLDFVRKSGLVDTDLLEDAVREVQRTEIEPSADELAELLHSRKLLTQWQIEHLKQGKYKGFLVGSHKILRVLGRGGHATVYLAEHLTLRVKRVIKVLAQKQLEGGTSLKQRFVREAQATARLDHPNIVRCYDVVVGDDLSYLVMEHFPGEDLDKYVRRHGPVPFWQALNFVAQVCHGLSYTQRMGMIHRDIKPSNLLLTDQGVVKILDLGLAMLERPEPQDASLTVLHDDNLGTADYIAPEQARASHSVDFRADIYALGCTMYQLLVGHPPFNEGTIVQRIARHQTEMPRRISELRPGCPRPIEAICWKMIQKKPEDRYQSYAELIDACNRLLKHPVLDPKPPSSLKLPRGPSSRPAATRQRPVAGPSPVPHQSVSLATVAPEPLVVPPELIDTDRLDSSNVTTDTSLPATRQDPFSSDVPLPIRLPAEAASSLPSDSSSGVSSGNPSRSGAQPTYAQQRARQEYLKKQRIKLLWIAIGILVGVGLTIGAITIIDSWGPG